MSRKLYLNGKFIDYKDATLHISDLAIIRGYGVFDFFRTQNGRPFLIDEHLARFAQSADQLALTLPSPLEEIKGIIDQLLALNGYKEAGIKLLLTGGYSNDGITPGPSNFFVDVQALQLPSEKLYEKGVKLMTHEYVREFPEVKSVNYATAIRLRHKLAEQNAADVLYHYKGQLSETSRSNFFIVHNGEIATPAENILQGVTRNKVLELAGPHYPISQRPVQREEIARADEAFITGTTKKVMPVVMVDDVVIGDGHPGKITRHLMALLAEFEASW